MFRDASRRIACLLAILAALAGCAGDDGPPERTGNLSAASGGDARALIGLDSAQVTKLLGPADFHRADGPAQILQYRGGTCVLDLYLYRDISTGQFLVKYVEARDHSFASVAADACLANVARNKRALISG